MLSRRQLLRGLPAVAVAGAATTLLRPSPALADYECTDFDAQGYRYCSVGLRIGAIETVRQECPYWCWAACIQAVFSLHGREVEQEEIVERLFGDLTCAPADSYEILYALQGDWRDRRGGRFEAWGEPLQDITSRLYSGGGAQDILAELQNNNPLINGAVGHATVITAATYAEDRWGNQQVLEIVVRDPWPTSPNRRVLQMDEIYGSNFLAKVVVA